MISYHELFIVVLRCSLTKTCFLFTKAMEAYTSADVWLLQLMDQQS